MTAVLWIVYAVIMGLCLWRLLWLRRRIHECGRKLLATTIELAYLNGYGDGLRGHEIIPELSSIELLSETPGARMMLGRRTTIEKGQP